MKIALSALVATLILLSGCAANVTEAGYYWGKYANTLYAYTKDPSDENLDKHVAELEEIVEKSKELDLKVPPGVHAELGYIDARRGNETTAMAHYEHEMSLYPEARVFLERLTATNE